MKKINSVPKDNPKDALTYDDVLLQPGASEVLPSEVSLSTWFSRRIRLNIPLASAAMDTVTEAEMAIALAHAGGIGVLHRNLPITNQAAAVRRVKKNEGSVIQQPITIGPKAPIGEAKRIMKESHISGIPVVNASKKLVGILTNRDLRFESDSKKLVSEVMTKENLITVSPGISLEESKKILHTRRIEKLLVVEDDGTLFGLITIKDIEQLGLYPHANKDDQGRLRVAAAVGTDVNTHARVAALVEAGVDAIVVDTAHGHSKRVMEVVRNVRKEYASIDVVAGNIATSEAAKALIDLGVDGVKVGIGAGSICTTRIVAGVGVPQLTAILNVSEITCEAGVPLIADGGIIFSGDIVKAFAAGADSVMLGSLLAGTDETPGKKILYQGRFYKLYRGMGSLDAMMEGSRDRYFQDEKDEFELDSKLVPEGIEGRVPYRGPVSNTIYQLVGGIRAGMGYVGACTLRELYEKGTFVRISPAGLRESHIHDVTITKAAPNYPMN